MDDIGSCRGSMPLFEVLGGDGGDHFERLWAYRCSVWIDQKTGSKEWETKNSLMTCHVAYHYSATTEDLKIHVSLSASSAAAVVVVVASCGSG